jgi:hypothetical protein
MVVAHSVLQEQDEATRARRYKVWKAKQNTKETYLLPETKKHLIVQVKNGRNWYPTSHFSLTFPKPMKKYSLGPHFFTQKPP